MRGETRETLRRVVADMEKMGCDDNMERMLLNAGRYVDELEQQLDTCRAENERLLNREFAGTLADLMEIKPDEILEEMEQLRAENERLRQAADAVMEAKSAVYEALLHSHSNVAGADEHLFDTIDALRKVRTTSNEEVKGE